MQKTARKNTKYSRIETILKISHFAKAIAHAKWSVWVKNEKCQKHAKSHSTRTIELFCAKTARQNTKYSRNERILKIGHFAKAIAHSKGSVWVKKLKMQKTCEKPFYKNSRVVLCRKRLEKKPNIQEMREF